MLGLFLLAALTVALLWLVWWLIFATEGVYLGRRVVIWLYDLYAWRYDHIKNYHPEYERWLLAEPIMGAIEPHLSPLVLDVATGTGRLPLALLNHPAFQGRVVALDLSRRMLHLAARKLQPFGARVELLWSPAEKLPFADGTFDVVVSLEALEFMTAPRAVLKELLRVLRPGGILLTSQRINTRTMPGKTWTEDELRGLLRSCGIDLVQFEAWQLDYKKVWALKAGEAPPMGARPLEEILRCPRCARAFLEQLADRWTCPNCKQQANIGADGVIELYPLYK